jgi:hypothetical protein
VQFLVKQRALDLDQLSQVRFAGDQPGHQFDKELVALVFGGTPLANHSCSAARPASVTA